ncbi:hypothetical protein BBP40_006005 [Aspergillus hancockii]|nr:hypothetical protein BBP40_006005 [Aspergillus hancockii]
MTHYQVNVAGDKHEFDPQHWATEPSQLPVRSPETNINVLIVGAGMGGLMTALECWRKGHNVIGILERNEGPVYSGDIIVLQPSALTTLHHYPDMLHDLQADQIHAAINYKTHTGTHIYGPSVPTFNDPEHTSTRRVPVAPAQIRRKFHRMLLRQLARLGLTVSYGQPVRSYFESADGEHGGVVLESGDTLQADIVVAADGLKSRSEILIAGQHAAVKSSGMSIFRTAYPRSLAMGDERVRARWGDSPPVWEYWLGPGMYIGVFVSPEIVSWGFTPRDTVDGVARESWEPDADPEEVVRAMQQAPGWDPAILALVRTAPRGAVVHWPLLWRDLRREWTSPFGRVVQAGDSAHSFIPTSGNGATQAVEDAITLAACLGLAGGKGVPVAARVYNLLRYERVSCAQKMSFVNSQLKTETDWEAVWREPKRIRTRFPRWIFGHDPEAYAGEMYERAERHLLLGEEFANTNIPPGHKFVPWTIEEVYRDIEAGRKVEDMLDGDWS